MANLLSTLDMATRNVADLTGRPEKSTEFQLHAGRGCARNVIDFTEHKLIRYASKTKDPQQKAVLMQLIEDYCAGLVAVAWRRGQPVHLRVTRET